MRPELSDLMREAKADAPPPRYDVDDVVDAGRRLQRRRRTGLAIVAVVAVAAAIGVPQIVTRGADRHRPVPVAPTVAPSAVRPHPFDYTGRGYTAGAYRVSEPTSAELWGYRAKVTKLQGDDSPGSNLMVLRPGIDPLAFFPGSKTVGTATVNGRPASFLDFYGTTVFLWDYAGGARAALWANGMTRDDMRGVAEKFVAVPARPVTIPIRMGYVPAGYRLVSLRGSSSADGKGSATLELQPDKVAFALLTPGKGPGLGQQSGGIFVVIDPLTAGNDPGSSAVTCTEAEAMCHVRVQGGRYNLQVSGRPVADLRRIMGSIRVADMARPDTWFEATTSVPVSAQLPAA